MAVFFSRYRILKVFLCSVSFVLFARAVDFMLVSLRWPLSICLDASLLRFESYSILGGRWPWRDIAVTDLPVTHFIHIAGLWIFGKDDIGFRLFDTAWVFFLGGIAFFYLRRYSKIAAWLGFAVVLTLPAEAAPYGAFQRETLMLPLWTGGLLIAEEMEKAEGKRLLLYGFFFGLLLILACFIKPTSLLLFAMITGKYINIKREGDFIRQAGALTGSVAAGLLLAVLLVMFPLLIAGVIPAFPVSWIEQSLIFQTVYGHTTISRSIPVLIARLITFRPENWFLPLNMGVETPVDTGHLTLFHVFSLTLALFFMRVRAPIFGFLLAGLLSYLLQRRGFAYHLYPVWFGLNLAMAVAVAGLYLLLSGGKENSFLVIPSFFVGHRFQDRIRPVLLSIVVLVGFSALYRQHRSLKAYTGTGLYDRRNPGRSVDFLTVEEIGHIAGELRRQGRTSITIQTFEDSSIALGSVMKYDLSFVSAYPVEYAFWEESKWRTEARERLMLALNKNNPDIIAYDAYSELSPERRRLDGFPQLKEFLEKKYRRNSVVHERTGGDYWIYIRSDAAGRGN